MQPSLVASVSHKAGSEVSNCRHLSLRQVAWRQGSPREAVQSGSCFVQIPRCPHRLPG